MDITEHAELRNHGSFGGRCFCGRLIPSQKKGIRGYLGHRACAVRGVGVTLVLTGKGARGVEGFSRGGGEKGRWGTCCSWKWQEIWEEMWFPGPMKTTVRFTGESGCQDGQGRRCEEGRREEGRNSDGGDEPCQKTAHGSNTARQRSRTRTCSGRAVWRCRRCGRTCQVHFVEGGGRNWESGSGRRGTETTDLVAWCGRQLLVHERGLGKLYEL